MQAEYIRNRNQLDESLIHLNTCSTISVDLEFDKNRFRYGFNLCLMQISSEERCFIIDPFENDVDVDLYFPLLENPAILKLVYSFGEDLRLLHSLNCAPKNLLDLNISVLLLNFPRTGLGTILEDVMNISLSASAQKSNWFLRPLSQNQIDYAKEDVIHLFKLNEVLAALAAKKGISEWIEEENLAFNGRNHIGESNSEVIKEKYKNDLTAFEWFVLKKLLFFREEIAEKLNRPSYQVIDPKILIEMSQEQSILNNWTNLRGIHREIKTKSFQKELGAFLSEVENEGVQLGVSKTESAKEKMSREEWKEMKREKIRKEGIKNELFKPIQIVISERYGEFAAPQILSNRLIMELINGERANLKNYKHELFWEISKDLNIDMSLYLSFE